jgi:2-iminoacetate synthase
MAEIDAISQSAFDLTSQAARQVADRRLQADTTASELFERITKRSDGSVREIESFLATPWTTLVDTHGPAAARSSAKHFGGRVGIFAPLYLSNACQNNCVYCGFRRSARFQRSTLSTQDSVREAAFLAAKGFRVLDLVTGEVSTDRFVDYVGDVTRAILENTDIDAVNLNIGSLSLKQYERLRAAGATGYHLYQESYDPDVYFGVHESGGKRDMASRLAGLHRAIDAGFEKVGFGLLLGLGPPAVELARMIGHADVIRTDAPNVTIGFSLPRIRPVDKGCSYEPEAMISDADFMKCMLFLRLRFPDAHLTVTTRERRELRDALLPIGITKVSAEVSTSPGGYTHSVETETGQFPISDRRTLDEMKWAIVSADLIPVLWA